MDTLLIKREPGQKFLVIINNEKFLDQCQRRGTNEDKKNLLKFAMKIGMKFHVCENLTAEKMRTFFRDIAMGIDKPCSYLMVAILSHGNEYGILGTDCKTITVSEVVEIFDKNNCKTLIEVPKIFLISACRSSGSEIMADGHETIDVDVVHENERQLKKDVHSKKEPDLVLIYSTLPGKH